MKISQAIDEIKKVSGDTIFGQKIEEETTRDKVLYTPTGIDIECTGIVTCIYPSPKVIKEAKELGANLIITHEALFWNHGDHQDWLQEAKNKPYLLKKKLLDDSNITVWRNHDYIHAMLPYKGQMVDGIYYGFAKQMGWEDYLVGNAEFPFTFEIPSTDVKDLIKEIIEKLDLEGVKVIGSQTNKSVTRVHIPFHIMGSRDGNDLINKIENEDIDVLIGQECVDFTVAEYLKDCGELGVDRTIIIPGHFNTEEYGMKFFAEYCNTEMKLDVFCKFVRAGDMYHYYK